MDPREWSPWGLATPMSAAVVICLRPLVIVRNWRRAHMARLGSRPVAFMSAAPKLRTCETFGPCDVARTLVLVYAYGSYRTRHVLQGLRFEPALPST